MYLKDYLDLDLNWRVFDERTVEFAQGEWLSYIIRAGSLLTHPIGMILHHLPGHTEGLMGLQLNRKLRA